MPLPLFIEFGCEEIPAQQLSMLAERLAAGLERELRAALLWTDKSQLNWAYTPRRLACHADHLLERQPDREEEEVGPPAKAAFSPEGKPTRAAEQFAAKFGLTPAALYRVTQPKGEYMALRHKIAGRSASELLPEIILHAWQSMAPPRTMRWDESGLEFLRPLRWMVALLGETVLPLRLGSIQAGRETRGHRSLGEQKIRLASADWDAYLYTLEKHFVLALPAKRRERIEAGIATAANGQQPRKDPELLELLVSLTEFPSVVRGEFDPGYLDLPAEVLVTVMRGHQRYFALDDANGKLAPAFLAIANQDRDQQGLIRHGNERVLRARFNDAQFFWQHDRARKLEDRLEDLKHISFHAKLGSYYEKAQRMQRLAFNIAETLPHTGEDFVRDANLAARLAKCDLGTELVKEFTELQGQIGGLLARAEGLRETATAIYEHYLPLSSEGEIPRTTAGAIVALADKLDTIVGMFGIGETPSGSRDPYALRRQGNGIMRILVDHKWALSLWKAMDDTIKQYETANYQAWNGNQVSDEVMDFFRERLFFLFNDLQKLPATEVRAALTSIGHYEDRFKLQDNPYDAWQRLQALHQERSERPDDFARTAEAFKRIRNIVEQAGGVNRWLTDVVTPQLRHPDESALHQAIQAIDTKLKSSHDLNSYRLRLREIAGLAPLLESYFQNVRVNDPDTSLRETRLRFLAWATVRMGQIGDLSQIAATAAKDC